MYGKSLLRQCLQIHSSFRTNGAKKVVQSLPLVVYYRQVVNLITFTEASLARAHSQKKYSRSLSLLKRREQVLRRTTMTSAMAHSVVAQNTGSNVLEETVAVIRYQPGDERFQMQITLQTGRTFNFDRAATDPVSNVIARMVTNMSKKVKSFNGTVKFLLENGNGAFHYNDSTIIAELLDVAVSAPSCLKIQVDEQVYEVIINPPEVYTAKFLGVCMPTLPVFPYRMETSTNFDKVASLYKWEFSAEKPSPGTPPKKKKADGDSSGSHKAGSVVWKECGSTFIYTPELGIEGGYLRFSCTPSNGKILGKPFSMVLSNPVVPLQVDNFLYLERLSRLSPKREEGDCLRVVSYNVLADTYATPEWFISSPKDSLEAGYRFPILNKEIQAYQADLICMQEVDDKFFEGNFEPFLSTKGYRGRHTSKSGSTKEGIATFHNTAKLNEIEFHQFVILEEMKTLPLWERLNTLGDKFTERLEERNTVFQISVFQALQCAKKTILIVGNVHLYFHPDADHIRLLQTITCINSLEKTVARATKEYSDYRIAVMFCGDFNCTPPFSSYRLLTTGLVEENDEDWTSHPEEKISPGFRIQHSLNLTNSHPAEELTNITTCFEGCLDYILYQAENLELLSICPPPSKNELAALTNVDELRKVSLPNFYTPSDHLPLIADLKFRP